MVDGEISRRTSDRRDVMNQVSGVAQVGGVAKRLREIFARYPVVPEPCYECEWCEDSGFVTCYREGGKCYPLRGADVFQARRTLKNELVSAVCRFCNTGTYRGKPVAGSLQSAERWVKENVTAATMLSGVVERAREAGYDELMLDQALKRCGVRKVKKAGRWTCVPPPPSGAEVQPYGEFAGFGG